MAYGVLHRITYCNIDGVTARLDILRRDYTGSVNNVSSDGNIFVLEYNNERSDKTGYIRSTSASINLYEEGLFTIDDLKTSDETELKVEHYIENKIDWVGFILPDFFQTDISTDRIVSMTATDRIGTLKDATLDLDTSSRISIIDLLSLSLLRTGLALNINSLADFRTRRGNDIYRFINDGSVDTESVRDVSCYDIVRSILVAGNAYITQRNGEWWVINKYQHEVGSGTIFKFSPSGSFISETSYSKKVELFDFVDSGGSRTVEPVAKEVGVFMEYGAGKKYPANYDFKGYNLGSFTNWVSNNGFTQQVENRYVVGYNSDGVAIYDDNIYVPNMLKNNNSTIQLEKYAKSIESKLFYSNNRSVSIKFSASFISKNNSRTFVGVLIDTNRTGSDRYLVIDGDGNIKKAEFFNNELTQTSLITIDFSNDKIGDTDKIEQTFTISAVLDSEMHGGLSFANCNLSILIYGSAYFKNSNWIGSGFDLFVTEAYLEFGEVGDNGKGVIYKTRQTGDKFTKVQDVDTTLFGDYIASGLNGYFYSYLPDNSSTLFIEDRNANGWTSTNDNEMLPLLQHSSRQRSRMFSKARDVLRVTMDAKLFDQGAIYKCGSTEYVVVSAKYNFFKSVVSALLEEIVYDDLDKKDYIYTYFGDDSSKVKSIGKASGGGSSGGGGGGLPPSYVENAGYAERAGTADNATHALMADVAGHANTADHATKADTADHALEADNSEKWNGLAQSDYVTQPVRPQDSPTWQGVTAVSVLKIPQATNSAVNALSKDGNYLRIGANKIWAGRADLWNGLAQPDYVTQPVRSTDKPRFEGIGSTAFASGFAGHGYRLEKDANGDYLLELDRLSVRKDFSVYELRVNQIRATNGSLWVSDGIKIDGVTVSGSNFVCSIDTDDGTIAPPFVANDIVRCHIFNSTQMKYYTARVVSVTSNSFTITKLEGASNPASGDELVRIGNTTNANRQGALYLTSSDSGAPYLDVIDGVTSASLAGKTRVRLGKLDGIVDSELGALSGYGLYGQNVFLKGVFQIKSGSNVYTKGETDGAVGQVKTEAAQDATQKANNAINEANDFSQGLIDGLEIGGRNYFGLYGVDSHTPYNTIPVIDGTKIITTIVRDTPGVNFTLRSNNPPADFKLGETYTISGYFEKNGNPMHDSDFILKTLNNRTSSFTTTLFNVNDDGFVTCILECSSNYSFHIHTHLDVEVGDIITVDKLKVEKGTKATDWSPAPEDVDAKIDTLRTETFTEFSVLDGKISSKVSQTDFNALDQRVGSAETSITQNANEIQQRATKSEVNAQVSAINSDIASITTRVTNAETSITQNADAIELRATKVEVTQEITTAVDGLEIGGRNLLLNSGIPIENGNYLIKSYPLAIKPNVGEEYIITIWGELAPTKTRFHAYNSGGNVSLAHVNKVADGLYQAKFNWRNDHPTSPASDTSVYIYAVTNAQSGISRIDRIKLEKGNKPSDWSPAPEDIDAEISSLTSRVISAETSITQNASEIALRATKSEVTTAKNDAINTSKNYTDSEITIVNYAINLKANQSDVTALGTRVSSAEAKITPDAINLTVKSQTEQIAQGAVDGLEIGGRNLLLNSIALLMQSNNNSVYPIENSYLEGNRRFRRIFPAGITSDLLSTYTNSFFEIESGNTYTLSIKVRPEANLNLRLTTAGSNIFCVADKWTTLFYTFDADETENRRFMGVYGEGFSPSFNPWIEYKEAKVEIGTKPTDWSPAPEDYSTTDEIKTSFTMTNNTISLLGQDILMTGKVTFASLDSNAQGRINTADNKATNAQNTANTATTKADNAQSTANTANNNLATLQGNLKALAYEDKVELARMGTTIVEGGYIKTSLLKVDEIFAQNVTATGLITANNLTVAGNSKIGNWSVNEGLFAGNAWGSLSTYSYFAPGDLLLRRNGVSPSSNSDIIEISMGYLGMGLETGMRVLNYMNQPLATNSAISVGAKGGRNNYAIDIFEGAVRGFGRSIRRIISEGSYTLSKNDDYVLARPNINGGINITLPRAWDGKVIIVHKPKSGHTLNVSTPATNKFNLNDQTTISFGTGASYRIFTYDEVNDTWWYYY